MTSIAHEEARSMWRNSIIHTVSKFVTSDVEVESMNDVFKLAAAYDDRTANLLYALKTGRKYLACSPKWMLSDRLFTLIAESYPVSFIAADVISDRRLLTLSGSYPLVYRNDVILSENTFVSWDHMTDFVINNCSSDEKVENGMKTFTDQFMSIYYIRSGIEQNLVKLGVDASILVKKEALPIDVQFAAASRY